MADPDFDNLQVIPKCSDWKVSSFSESPLTLYCPVRDSSGKVIGRKVWLELGVIDGGVYRSSRDAKNRLVLTCYVNGVPCSSVTIYPTPL